MPFEYTDVSGQMQEGPPVRIVGEKGRLLSGMLSGL